MQATQTSLQDMATSTAAARVREERREREDSCGKETEGKEWEAEGGGVRE